MTHDALFHDGVKVRRAASDEELRRKILHVELLSEQVTAELLKYDHERVGFQSRERLGC